MAIERPSQGEAFDTCLLACAQGRFVLKTGDTLRKIAELEDEFRVLEELRDQRPFVAQPVAQVIDGTKGAFLFTYVDGESMLDALGGTDAAGRHRLVAEFGHALRRIHGWRPALPHPIDWVSEAIRRAAANVAAGGAGNAIGLTGRLKGRNPRDVLDGLYAWRGRVEDDLVFCHGDYCLPNVLVSGERVTGVVDWSAGGYADRRFDLAAGQWTIRHNLGRDEYVDTFLRAYGYAAPAATLDDFEALYALL